MTVTYTAEVATSGLGTFLKLLRKWRGSVYKLLWKDFLIFLILYYIIAFIYRFALNEDQKRMFEKVALYCDAYNNLIPVAFVLGFYVSVILTRWWDQISCIPWPDRMAIFVTACIHGNDERGRLMRRTIMRYLNLALVLIMSSISTPVKKRFPTLDHITDAGIMTKQEQEIYENIKSPHNKYFVPLVWATSLITRARKEARIKDDMSQQTVIQEINQFRGGLGMLLNYDWLSMPLVYTQVVTLAVQTFFLSCLFGRQFLDPKQGYPNHSADIYVPVFTFLQYLFYMGWLKVAESLTNPFGEDDDDFETNATIDRNMQVSYLIVDEMHNEHPDLIKDQYWDEVDFEIPYTAAAEQFKTDAYLGSTDGLSVSLQDSEFVPALDNIEEEPDDIQFRGNMYKSPKFTFPTDIPRHPVKRRSSLQHMQTSKSNKSRFPNIFRRTASRDNASVKSSSSIHTPRSQKSRETPSVRSDSPPHSPTSHSTYKDQHEDIFTMSDLNVSQVSVEMDEVSTSFTPGRSRKVPLGSSKHQKVLDDTGEMVPMQTFSVEGCEQDTSTLTPGDGEKNPISFFHSTSHNAINDITTKAGNAKTGLPSTSKSKQNSGCHQHDANVEREHLLPTIDILPGGSFKSGGL